MRPTSRPRRRRLPARVYWFRRALVLAVALGMVFGIARLLGGGTSEAATDPAAQVVGAAPPPSRPLGSPTSTASTEARTVTKVGQQPKAQETKTPLAEPTGPCPASDIVATPKVDGTAYAGSPVKFRIELTTRTTPACTWRASPSTLAVKLVSGADRIWSSQDCPAVVPEEDVIVRKDLAAVVTVTWRGQRSDDSCSRTMPWALPGFYHVQAAAFGAEPTDAQFELRLPVPVTITPKPKPEKSGKPEEAPSSSGPASPSAKPEGGKPDGRGNDH